MIDSLPYTQCSWLASSRIFVLKQGINFSSKQGTEKVPPKYRLLDFMSSCGIPSSIFEKKKPTGSP